MALNDELIRNTELMRQCRDDFMFAAREFRLQRRPAAWVVAQVRMARFASRLLVEDLRAARAATS